MARATQSHRPIAVGTPLGEDVLLLRGFTYTEKLGRPFEMHLDMLSDTSDLSFDDIVGQNVTVRVQKPSDDQPRYFNGLVSRFVEGRLSGRTTQYEATVVPWLWLLTRTSDCRIFQEMTVPDIIKKIFRDHGFTDFEERLSGSYRTWEYCVQYRETDFNFVGRLMEQEGIYYFFTHENGKHTLVLADSPGSHEPYPGYAEVPFRPPDSQFREKEYIHDVTVCQEVQPGVYAHTDYDFKSPKKDLQTKSQIIRNHAAPEFEIFDFPGEFVEHADGVTYSRSRIEELQTPFELAHGESDVRGLSAGFKFKLLDHPRDAWNKDYLAVAVTVRAATDEYDSAPGAGGGTTFQCTFTAMDFASQFRSPRTTPKPMIRGAQTALVAGPSGEEIHTDQYGRVKVQFHWDRYSKADENSSCWIRVSQPWAGKKWGQMFIPRIGQEVIVEFLEGDPDQPIIVGRVYNGDAMPPYELPSNMTMSTIKSNSSKGGGGWNELRFEDKKGSEQIFIHAQKNMDERVLADSKEWIGNDRHLIVKKKQYELIEEDKHLHVKGNHQEKIDKDMHLHVVGNENIKADQNISRQAGSNTDEKTGMKWAHEAGQEIHLKAGMKVIIEAGLQLTIKGAGGFVDIGPAGVTIQGTMVNINSGGSAGVGSGSSPTSPTDPEDAKEADDDNAGSVDEPPPGREPPVPVTYSSQAQVLQQAAENGTPFCEKCAAAAAARQQQQSQ
ncbi:MAG TPA: type VI secretion system tip protein VgrG [Phycisphaerae bacterium]|nr:type VI secretion system tip protein VgrG [Phycisphaerae bacterium]